MSKRMLLSAALALALAGGAAGTATLPVAVPVAAPLAAAQSLPAAAAPVVAAAEAAVPLSTMEMSVVQGAGIFSFFKKAWKSVKKFVAGVLKSFLNSLINSWIDQIFGVDDGGAKQEKTETVTENYATQADYDAGVTSSTATDDGSWVTTETWYGSGGGCGGDSGRLDQGLYYDREVSVC